MPCWVDRRFVQRGADAEAGTQFGRQCNRLVQRFLRGAAVVDGDKNSFVHGASFKFSERPSG